jgi:nucleoid-associated protein YgaU
MRKDLRIGLGIGGVLLAVLIVTLVVRSNNQKKHDTQASAQGTGQEDPANPYAEDPAATPPDPAGHTPAGPADTGAPQMPPLPKADGKPAGGAEEPSDPFAKPDPSVAGATGTSRDWNMILARERSDNPAPGAPPPVVPPRSDARHRPESGPSQAGAHIPRADTAGTERVGSSLFTGSRTPGERSYVVKSGDTLISIARAHYGNPRLYQQIMKANPGVEPETMKPGTKLVLPELSAVQASRKINGAGNGTSNVTGSGTGTGSAIEAATAGASAGLRPVDPKLEYRIQSGDSLARISQKLYGAENKVEALYNANRDAIGPDREKLKLGMVLRLPEPPTSTASR